MPTNYYQEKITSFAGGPSRTTRSAPLANIAKFRAEAGDISVFDIYTDFVSVGIQQFTLRINGVDQIPVPANRPDLNGVDHDTYTPGAPIAVADGDIISVDLTAVGGTGVNAPLYIRIGIDVAGGGGGSGVVETIVAGAGITVDDTDPANPEVAADPFVQTVTAGTGITVDNTDPQNPIIEASGGGGGGDGLYSPDFPYGTPSTEDDEFNTGSLDAKWATLQNAPATAFTVPNHLQIGSGHATQASAIVQTISDVDQAFRMKITPPKNSASGLLIGFACKEAGANRLLVLAYSPNNGNFYYDLWTNFTAVNTSNNVGNVLGFVKQAVPAIYMEMAYIAATNRCYYSISLDGIKFYPVIDDLIGFGGAIDKIGIFCNGSSTDTAQVDWFRRVQGVYTGGNS